MNKNFLLFLLIISILSISAASAHDAGMSNQTTLEDSQNDVATGDFAELNGEISSIETGGNLTLNKDYAYSSDDSDYRDGIKITQDNIMIDGDGHTIDGKGQARIFNISSNNVTLKNINMIFK